MFGFAGAILAGTALLLLPFSAADGRSTGIVDALFTATSAVCVTGLTVLDTATHWSGFGLAVIMLLIQLGGLGIMIFASLVGLLIARRFSMRARMTAVPAVSVRVRLRNRGGSLARPFPLGLIVQQRRIRPLQ